MRASAYTEVVEVTDQNAVDIIKQTCDTQKKCGFTLKINGNQKQSWTYDLYMKGAYVASGEFTNASTKMAKKTRVEAHLRTAWRF